MLSSVYIIGELKNDIFIYKQNSAYRPTDNISLRVFIKIISAVDQVGLKRP